MKYCLSMRSIHRYIDLIKKDIDGARRGKRAGTVLIRVPIETSLPVTIEYLIPEYMFRAFVLKLHI